MPAVDRDEGRRRVVDLITRYERNYDHYRSASFDEESAREYFINPLFEALGWDVRDLAGRGARRDVVYHQRLSSSIELGGQESWDEELSTEELAARNSRVAIPDYSFRVGGSTRFFVEAKRPLVSLRQRGPAFQVKSYAWSQQVPIAILTNFEGLRVFDCRVRPLYEEPERGLLENFDLTWRDYPENWDRLWDTLSRPSVATNSLETLLGRSSMRGSVPVDEAFLRELEDWRERLAHDLMRRNVEMTSFQIAEATQRILDRLVFLRVCEDRGVEPEVRLRRYARTTDAYRKLCHEFRVLDGVYNGQLFAEHFSEQLEVSDGLFQKLIASLYFPAPYRFDAISSDLLGSIYERFLGKEISIVSGDVEVADKPEVRHAGGVYYTPRWVVDRVVAQTLDPLLAERRTPATPRTMSNLRILDFSCGSGSFLIGALDYLVSWHEQYYSRNPTEDPERHYLNEIGARKLTTDAKAQIVTNCLYGIDIDPQAVEVAQMNLYLRILEGESAASLDGQNRLFHGALLPTLANNIRCGNSLLSPNQVETSLLYDEVRRRRINPFDWRDDKWGFGQVFKERGGFDAIIGNPPYTRVQVLRKYRPEETNAYERYYKAAQSGSFDIASLFIEKAFDLLRPASTGSKGGRLGLITSRQFVETDAGQPVRQIIAPHLYELVDFTTGLVFAGASAYTLLLHASAGSNRKFRLTRVPPPPSSEALWSAEQPGSALSSDLATASLGVDPWSLSLPEETTLLDRLADTYPSLQDVSNNSIFQGVVTGADKIFRLRDLGEDTSRPGCRLVRPQSFAEDEPPISIEAALLRPICAGRTDLRRFSLAPVSEWLLLPYERAEETKPFAPIAPARFAREYPQAWSWLNANRERLESRSGAWNEANWFTYSRRQNLEKFAESKLLVPYMVDQMCAAWDTDGRYFVNVSTGGYGVEVDPNSGLMPEFLAALLNSALATWVMRRRSRAWRGGWFGARKGNLALIPIATTSKDKQLSLIASYKECRQLHSQLAQAVADNTADELLSRVVASKIRDFDNQVFDLYGLSQAERRLVSSGLPEPADEVASMEASA